jgi:hypothetical protein
MEAQALLYSQFNGGLSVSAPHLPGHRTVDPGSVVPAQYKQISAVRAVCPHRPVQRAESANTSGKRPPKGAVNRSTTSEKFEFRSEHGSTVGRLMGVDEQADREKMTVTMERLDHHRATEDM